MISAHKNDCDSYGDKMEDVSVDESEVFFQARHGFTQLNFTYKLYNGCK
jgi:hypothetical protein